jgi:hypothetical protein
LKWGKRKLRIQEAMLYSVDQFGKMNDIREPDDKLLYEHQNLRIEGREYHPAIQGTLFWWRPIGRLNGRRMRARMRRESQRRRADT